MTKLYKSFNETGSSVNVSPSGEAIVTGNGLVIFRPGRNEPHVFYHRREQFEPNLNGCHLALDESLVSPLHLVGVDHTGKTWNVYIDNNTTGSNLRTYNGECRVRLLPQQIVDLLTGRPFAEVIAEFVEAARAHEIRALSAEIKHLKSEQEFARRARQVFAEVHRLNENGGRGSRSEVRKLLLGIMPKLAK